MKSVMTIFACVALAGSASAQDLVYKPINPSFGGNSFNSAHLLAIANAQNDYEAPEVADDPSDELDRFVRSLQSRLLSSLSTQVANAIFGENAQDSGTIRFGDQTISFVRTLDGVELTITDGDGTVTVITIPTLQTNSTDGESSSKLTASSGSVTGSFDSSEGSLTYKPLLASGPLESTSLQPLQQPIQ